MSKEFSVSPLVSIVVPNFNYARFLPECLESLLSQSYQNLEIIVVDDGSTDNSVEVLKRYSARIKYFVLENNGVNHARNFGLRASGGEYVAFCDSDDWWEPNKIELQLQLLSANQDLSLVYCGINIIDFENSTKIYSEPKYRGQVGREILRYPTRALVKLGASTALLRKSFLDLYEITWNDSLKLPSEDINFFNKIALKSEIDYVIGPLVNYRQHPYSRSKMSAREYVLGNRQSFCDFARYSRGQLKYHQLQISWMRLNILLTKHAISMREWNLVFSQLKYFFRSYSSSR